MKREQLRAIKKLAHLRLLPDESQVHEMID
jgi:hypothetical protein